MRTKFFIVLYVLTFTLSSFSQDVQRLSETEILGTARFVGMAGAMTAVGGDPSAVIVNNPAGVGVYKRFEAMFSFDIQIDRSKQQDASMMTQGETTCFPSLASLVFSWGKDKTAVSHALMISYQRLKTWNRTYLSELPYNAPAPSITRIMAQNATGIDPNVFADVSWWDDPGIGWLTGAGYCDSLISATDGTTDYFPVIYDNETLTSTYSSEVRGRSNQYGLTYGVNINSRWCIGIGLNILSYNYRRYTDYYEYFGQGGNLHIKSNLNLIGSGVSASIGFIGHPLQWLRVGASFQTPSTIVNKTTQSGFVDSYFSEEQAYQTDIDGIYSKDIDFSLPLKSSVGLAFQFQTHGLISLQYDFMHWQNMPNVHTLRIGGEYVLNNQLYFNAGYAIKSNFMETYRYALSPTTIRFDTDFENLKYSQNACVAFGFRGRYFMGQIAYQYNWQKENVYAFETADPYEYKNKTSHVVVTIGLHL